MSVNQPTERTYPRSFFVLLAALVSLATASGEDVWPEFRGPHGDGTSVAANLPTHWSETEGIVWNVAVPGRGWSSPVVRDGKIWLTTATPDGKQMFVRCLDAKSGATLVDSLLFENAEPAEIHVLNSYASPTPVVTKEHVYISFGSYGTACLDTRDGKVIWQRRDIPLDHYRGPGSSPVVFDRFLILHMDGYDAQFVVALDRKTGATVWRTDRDVEYGTTDGDMKKAFTTPLVINVDGSPQLVSCTSKAILGYDPFTGRDLWKLPHEGFSSGTRPSFHNGLIYFVTGHGGAEVRAVRPGSTTRAAETVWTTNKAAGTMSSPVFANDLLFYVSDGGIASCVDAATGKTQWTKRIGGSFSASPLAGGGNVYFSDREGTTTVVRAAGKYDEVAANRLNIGCMASHAVIDSDLIVRTETHVYRITRGK